MPNAKKTKSGAWNVRIYSHTEYVDGKPKRIKKSFTAPTKKEAEYQALLYKRQHPQYSAAYDMTLGTAMISYIDSKDGILSPSTVRGYRSMQRLYLTELQKKPLFRITNLDIQRALNADIKQRDLSPKTARNIAGFVSASISLFRDDFSFNITLPEKEKSEFYLPTKEDINILLEYTEAHDTDLYVAILLASFLGLRRGEIGALKWSDFNWSRKTVKIRKALVLDDSDTWHTKAPKSYAGNRTLSVSDKLLRKLKKVRSEGNVIKVSPTLITHHFRRTADRLGLEHFTFHDLRHFYASMLLMNGVPDKYAMERMGHATPNMLKNVYQHTEVHKQNEINHLMNNFVDSFF